jgi:SAM-dependent methyltransferase
VQTTSTSAVSFRCADVGLRCHVCGSSQLNRRFSVPLSDGPYRYDKDIKRREIYQCDSCGHLLAGLNDPSEFSTYYASLSADCHSSIHDSDQFRYQQVLEALSKRTVSRVLDIGCGTGTFLARLPPGVERFGIEPTRAAAVLARAKGVRIIQYDDLVRPELQNTFDAVTAIDVLEHETDLQEFRRHLTSALRPGGTVILLTGDAQSRPARVLGRYWYYLNGWEHITFFCPRSMRTWLEPDFRGIEFTKTNHNQLRLECSATIRSWLTFPVKWLLRELLRMRLNKYVVLYLPGDHMLVRAICKQPLTREAAIDAN